jgi:bacterioferritin (cytochrome b1)
MVSKSDLKNLFQSSLKERLTKKDKKAKKKENAEGDDDSLYMNVFEKLMEGKHITIVNKSNDDLKSINDTNTFYYSMQDKMTSKYCEDDNYNNDYD